MVMMMVIIMKYTKAIVSLTCDLFSWKDTKNQAEKKNQTSKNLILNIHSFERKKDNEVEMPACLIVRLLFGFASYSDSVKLNKNIDQQIDSLSLTENTKVASVDQ